MTSIKEPKKENILPGEDGLPMEFIFDPWFKRFQEDGPLWPLYNLFSFIEKKRDSSSSTNR